jgi:hypothetical protein
MKNRSPRPSPREPKNSMLPGSLLSPNPSKLSLLSVIIRLSRKAGRHKGTYRPNGSR